MRFEETPLVGAYVIALEPIEDERGAFVRTFCAEEFARHGLLERFVQFNLSRNHRAGTLRGMHWQEAPHAEVKLVRASRGAIFDCIVDLRASSKTRGRWFGVELDSASGHALYVPAGFAHGFQTLTEDAEVSYAMGAAYAPAAARGFRHDDPRVGIRWPLDVTVISERDAALPDAPLSDAPPADTPSKEPAS